jgi:hypothetical protein
MTTTLRTEEYTSEVSFNSAGYRDLERVQSKPERTRRVALFGDSFVEALQVPFEKTAGMVLERFLRDRLSWPSVEVLNFGQSGFGTACSYLTYARRGRLYQPDVVVLSFYVGNDIYDNHPRLAVQPAAPYFQLLPEGGVALHALPVYDGPVKAWFRSHSRVYAFIRDRVKRIRALARLGESAGVIEQALPALESERVAALDRSIYRPGDPLVEEAWQVTESVLKLFRDEATSHGAAFVVLIIPTIEQFDQTARQAYLRRRGESGAVDPELDFLLPTKRLRAFLNRERVTYADLLDYEAYSRTQPRFLHLEVDGHWTELGNSLAAQALAEPVGAILGERARVISR